MMPATAPRFWARRSLKASSLQQRVHRRTCASVSSNDAELFTT